MQKGINSTFSKLGVEWGKKNEAFINQFKENTNIFAAFKSHEESNQLAKLMTKEDGTLRSFYEFKKESQKIIGDYNVAYLQTEYNAVVRSARSAANWKKFEENADIFPNLEYMESRATDKRVEHLHFVGTVLPINDPFWNTHTPPISWGCQCWLRQTKAEATDLPSEEYINPVFKNNPGVTAEPFVIDETSYAKRSAKQSVTRDDAKEFVQQQEITTIRENRAKVFEWAKSNIKGSVLQHTELADVKITTRSIKEWLNQPHSQNYLKDNLLYNIKDVFPNSTYVGTTYPKRTEKQGHLFEVVIAGLKSWIIVKEYFRGEKILYSISDNASILKQLKKKV